jgi:hypothetical protein
MESKDPKKKNWTRQFTDRKYSEMAHSVESPAEDAPPPSLMDEFDWRSSVGELNDSNAGGGSTTETYSPCKAGIFRSFRSQ